MRIVFGSAFRNSASNVSRYMRRIAELRNQLSSEDRVRVVAVEGDSKDFTRRELEYRAAEYCVNTQVVVCEHGGPEFGSVDTPERMKALSKVGNAIFDSVRPDDDILVYVESDLFWEADDILSLIQCAHVRANGWDVATPLVLAAACFYDIWAYRDLLGNRFSPFSPYCAGLQYGPMEISSAGSCLVMRGEVARACRIRDENCLVGWCADAREQGFRIGIYPEYYVRQA